MKTRKVNRPEREKQVEQLAARIRAKAERGSAATQAQLRALAGEYAQLGVAARRLLAEAQADLEQGPAFVETLFRRRATPNEPEPDEPAVIEGKAIVKHRQPVKAERGAITDGR